MRVDPSGLDMILVRLLAAHGEVGFLAGVAKLPEPQDKSER